MKKVFLLAAMIFVGGMMANAQEKISTEKKYSPKEVEEWIDNRVDHMEDMLDLNDAQEDKIERIFKKYFGKGQARTPERMKAMHEEIWKVLTPEQQKKMEARRGQHKNCPHQGKGQCNQHKAHQNKDCDHSGNKNCPHQK